MSRVKKLILKSFLSPGDILMLTAALRDLHRCHPDQFQTDVRTSCPDLWENNPFLTPLDEKDPDVETIACDYPLIEHSNDQPYHFIHGYIHFLNDRLGLRIRPQLFKGDIHLSAAEKQQPSYVAQLLGENIPYWIIVAGGKYDNTIKWWDHRRFQDVVDAMAGRLLFVQAGSLEHFHPRLNGVLDLRGKTTLRETVHLMHHSSGVLCPVTFFMHLSAAVESPEGRPATRPCVVIAGGRESTQWEAYPAHQFLHTIGSLPCCEQGGCWRSRTFPLGDRDSRDEADQLCVNVVGKLPRCMDLITPAKVINGIETYMAHPRNRPLTSKEAAHLGPFLTKDSFRVALNDAHPPVNHPNQSNAPKPVHAL